jgi:uncharacterized protein (DUF2267 family)
MELPMEKGETLNGADTSSEWPDKVRALLDSYLCEFGLSSEATRARWIGRVVDDLATRDKLVAEDILEEAVEQMRDLIEARIAMVSNYDPAHEHKEIAQIMVLLLNEKNADCLNSLFESSEPEGDFEQTECLRQILASSLPIAVPDEAPLAMPVQTIELRSINPLRRLFGRAR